MSREKQSQKLADLHMEVIREIQKLNLACSQQLYFESQLWLLEIEALQANSEREKRRIRNAQDKVTKSLELAKRAVEERRKACEGKREELQALLKE